jgi:hypothetical protein
MYFQLVSLTENGNYLGRELLLTNGKQHVVIVRSFFTFLEGSLFSHFHCALSRYHLAGIMQGGHPIFRCEVGLELTQWNMRCQDQAIDAEGYRFESSQHLDFFSNPKINVGIMKYIILVP